MLISSLVSDAKDWKYWRIATEILTSKITKRTCGYPLRSALSHLEVKVCVCCHALKYVAIIEKSFQDSYSS